MPAKDYIPPDRHASSSEAVAHLLALSRSAVDKVRDGKKRLKGEMDNMATATMTGPDADVPTLEAMMRQMERAERMAELIGPDALFALLFGSPAQ